ncbi:MULTISPECIES: ImmA/IrrE family metallo-endopeptidase [Acinetobacter]|uniref:ImmA/IrrE family metallo-endopeptidase n=1 Tax=Acinetobacter TaxID=469 RepID=UPI000F742D8F|nr:ImmA/IrrE family metallo-endopeptidase [Acinetobacter haemolyticus]RSN73885.1 ImmA/IrrE family metallo-endopeptidase [Acinetobacter haemolyticus]
MSTEIKVIRTDEQYRAYLEQVEALMDVDTSKNQATKDTLDLLCLLIQDYETKHFQLDIPDPIDAIIFRMKELNLKQADLAPYFGTTSRVSEVLNGKRKLTVEMIRALSIGLNIPAETLISPTNTKPSSSTDIDWKKFPVKEMESRGWIKIPNRERIAEIVSEYLANSGLNFTAASYKRTLSGEAYSPNTKFALHAWLSRVVQKSRSTKTRNNLFHKEIVNKEFLREIAQLSWLDNGPLLAVKKLESVGISIVIESHLKGTRVDGACLKDFDGKPIIALSLRYDRLDNFWFTLLHELAHVMKHLDENDTFIDDLEHNSVDHKEAEANRLAREAFIPRGIWKTSDAFLNPTRENIYSLANELRIHPAVIAGRLRSELNDYTIFNDLLGQNEVKKFFNSELTYME